MLSIDTNLLFQALDRANSLHAPAANFLASLNDRNDVVISEFVLAELYQLIRNPVILESPVSAGAAVKICEEFRCHPNWQVVGLPGDSREFHDAFWPKLAEKGFARRRAYDWRIALSLLQQGVTEFATANTKDFKDFGFKRVWNPLA